MNETEITETSPLSAFLPATIVPDLRLSDEQLEMAIEKGLDDARIRCERTEKGSLRAYSPPPQQIWLMIHIFHREMLGWFGRTKATGLVTMRRRFFLRDNSMLCPDIAYVASGIDKRPSQNSLRSSARTPESFAGSRTRCCSGWQVEWNSAGCWSRRNSASMSIRRAPSQRSWMARSRWVQVRGGNLISHSTNSGDWMSIDDSLKSGKRNSSDPLQHVGGPEPENNSTN